MKRTVVMGIPENIDAMMVEFDITASSIARAAGVSEAAVSDWRNKGVIPRKQNLDRLCNHFKLTPDDILSDAVGFAAKVHGRVGKGFVSVPLYGTVAAGISIEMLPVDEMKEAPARYVDDDPDAYLVKVKGESMNRQIHDGEFALVSPKYREPNNHDMFLVTVNGYDATIKKVRKLENGVELVPDSYDPTFRPKIFDFGEMDTPEIKILGKVVWWCKDF
jgi:repressor LexA